MGLLRRRQPLQLSLESAAHLPLDDFEGRLRGGVTRGGDGILCFGEPQTNRMRPAYASEQIHPQERARSPSNQRGKARTASL
jgi:hypothetical protein